MKQQNIQQLSFLQKIIQYFTNPNYYLAVTFQPLKNNFLILLSVMLLVALPWSVQTTKKHLSSGLEYFSAVSNDAVNNYPDDLQFNWSNQELKYSFGEVIAQEPLIIPFSEKLPKSPPGFPHSFAYITNQNLSPDDAGVHTTEYLFFINPSHLYTASEVPNQNWEQTKLSDLFSDINSASFTKSDFIYLVNSAKSLIESNQNTIYGIYFLLLIPIFVTGKFWILFMETIFVVLFFKIYGMKLTIKQTLSLCMSVFIPTLVISTLAELLFSPLPFALNTFAFWIVLMFILFSLRNTKMLQVKTAENNED